MKYQRSLCFADGGNQCCFSFTKFSDDVTVSFLFVFGEKSIKNNVPLWKNNRFTAVCGDVNFDVSKLESCWQFQGEV